MLAVAVLLAESGGFDGGEGFTVAARGDDLHVLGTMAPIVPGYIGCVVIRPDGSRQRARVMPDPLVGRD